MVSLELVEALLQQFDVLLEAGHALSLHLVMPDLRRDQVDGDLVVFCLLREAKGQNDEQHLVVRVHLLVVSLLDDVFGQNDGIPFELERALVASEDVLGEDLEHDDDSEHSVRVVKPVVVFALGQLLKVLRKQSRDFVVVRTEGGAEGFLFGEHLRVRRVS